MSASMANSDSSDGFLTAVTAIASTSEEGCVCLV